MMQPITAELYSLSKVQICGVPSGRTSKELTLVKAVEGEVYLCLSDCINFVVSNYYESLGCYASGEPAIRHASENLCSLPLCCFTCCSQDRTCVTCNLRRDRMQILKTKTSKSSNSVASFEVFADFGATINAGLFIQHVTLTPLKAAQ